LVNTYVYDSFGNLAASTGTLTNPFQYTGRDFDPETGLRYYRARYYDAQTGRFLSEDPLGFGGGDPNSYDYALNSPINVVDPFGLQGVPTGTIGTTTAWTAAEQAAYQAFARNLTWLARLRFLARFAPMLAFEIVTPEEKARRDRNAEWLATKLPSWMKRKPTNKTCNKTKEDCDERHGQEQDFCLREYSKYPNLLHKCMERAMWRWNNCLRGFPDPGPLDPLDPNWSPN
jgi:RHS repeat-associated protein